MPNNKIKNKLIFLFAFILITNNLCFAQNIESQVENPDESVIEKEKDFNEIDTDTNDPEIKEIKTDKPTLLKGYVSKIPGGTKLKIIFETPVDELTSMVGDEITAKISENIIINGDNVVPAGSTVNGTISEINLARRLHRAGSIRIEFKNVSIPDGRQIPIVANVLTRSGLLKGKLTKKNALISGSTIIAPIAAGFGAGLAAEGSAAGGTIGAVVGAIAGLSLFAYQRGNMVDIRAGDEINIELTEEALIPSADEEFSKSKSDKNTHGFCEIK